MKKIVPLLLLIMFLNTGFAYAFPKVTPDITQKPVAIPDNWNEQSFYISQNDPIITWWEQFNDPQLTQYIYDTVTYNYNIQAAIAHIQQVKSLKTIEQANLLPKINAKADYSRYQFFASQGERALFQTDEALSILQTGLGSTWEIDFFGKKRWQIESATQNIEVANEQKRTVLISAISEVARNYMELRGSQHELLFLDQSINVQKTNLALLQAKYKIGLAPQIDIVNAKTTLESTIAKRPAIEASIKISAYNISVLTGRNPDILFEELTTLKPLPIPIPIVDSGTPAEIILKRPDIREAKRKLASALAEAGAAKADLYPSIKLNNNLTFTRVTIGELSNFQGGLWALMPTFDWKLFDRRSLKASYNAKKSAVQKADAELRQTILDALKEVESSIASLEASKDNEQATMRAAISSQKSFQMVSNSYNIGLKNKLDLLDSEKNYLEYQSQLIKSRTQINLKTIKLYKDLGGGWEAF